MNKNDLAKEIAGRMSVTATQAQRFIDTMDEVITESLKCNESVLIQNFGHYVPWKQAKRMGRNPRTGQECIIRERISVKFKPGKGLIDKINGE
ncbi:HU family DNA-binding protein [uncultured Parabacteroides sp.]|uniref:HU family DNA-binding protein n=1 Tax=uncultured Parabacteroides sp. TaxID=512312 RepID=UPI002585B31B|nr:HU family DNA-binding protein [uncultured Parabacteroides sp.]